jgi:chemotaxis protein MotB
VSIKSQPVIIIKKKKGHHGGHHGGAWKVAYADFVTAMMAFFLVMWLVTQGKDVRAAVGGYFRNPGVFESQYGQGVLPGGRGVDDAASDAAPGVDAARKALEDASRLIQERLDQNPAFASLRDQIEFTVTPDGLRIDLIDQDESSFFDSGSALFRGEAEQILAVIGRELGTLGNQVAIEGHTDSRQYASGDRYSNWELSADRANAARRALEQYGLTRSQVSAVQGYADRLLRIPDNPLDSRNRRVSILVKHQVASSA